MFVDENGRPQLPSRSRFNTPRLQSILALCWATKPADRPVFSKVSRDLKLLRKAVSSSQDTTDLDSPNPIGAASPSSTSDLAAPHTPGTELPSPDLRPVDLPEFLQTKGGQCTWNTSVLTRPETFSVKDAIGTKPSLGKVPVESTSFSGHIAMPVPVLYTPAGFTPLKTEESVRARRKTGTLITSGLIPPGSAVPKTAEDVFRVIDFDGYDSPTPVDERVALIKHERRYRLLLTHEYGSPCE